MSAQIDTPQLARFDTNAVRAADRFDYWRALHPGVDLEPLEWVGNKPSFSGSVHGLVSAEASMAVTHTIAGGPHRSRFNDAAREVILIGCLSSGRIVPRGADGEADAIDAGRPYLVDVARADLFQTQGFENLFMSMPRREVIRMLGAEPPSKGGVRLLPDTPLGRIFLSHLKAVSREAGALEPDERREVLGAARSLAGAFLGACAEEPALAGHTHAEIVAAARRCMADMLHQPDLTVTKLARLIGYSRSRLYRAFEAREISIAGTLTEMRMTKARALLDRTGAPVGDIAQGCGYRDVSAFSQAFRRRHGCAPRDYRMRNR